MYSGSAKETDPEVMKSIVLYFNLCSEEYHLFKKGYVPDDVWDNWIEGMRITVGKPIYTDAWKTNAKDYNEDFRHFMNNQIFPKQQLY